MDQSPVDRLVTAGWQICGASKEEPVKTGLPPLADPGELSVSCLVYHHSIIMPVAALLLHYAAETPFPEMWGGFRCSACGSAG
jgi:hypothetical protein